MIQLTSRIARLAAADLFDSAAPLSSGGEGSGAFVGTFFASLTVALSLSIPAIIWRRWVAKQRREMPPECAPLVRGYARLTERYGSR